jgi:hypothetical protein
MENKGQGRTARAMPTKAADMLIARRADTRARADFATWKMLAKLNGFSALPAEAQSFGTIGSLLMTDDKWRPPSSSWPSGIMPRWAAPARRRSSPRQRSGTDNGNVTAFRRPPHCRVAALRPAKARPAALIFRLAWSMSASGFLALTFVSSFLAPVPRIRRMAEYTQ